MFNNYIFLKKKLVNEQMIFVKLTRLPVKVIQGRDISNFFLDKWDKRINLYKLNLK